MRALLRRAAVAFALAPCLVFGPVMPAEHVHEIDDAHEHAVAHRHVAFHQHAESDQHNPATDHDDAEFQPDDDRVVWVASVALHQGVFQLNDGAAIVDAVFVISSMTTSTIRRVLIDASPPHGPPRPHSSQRGPPLASA